jgi:hypothetical protein
MIHKHIGNYSVEQQQKIILLILLRPKQLSLSKNPSIPSDRSKWLRKFFEIAVISLATWLNPQATIPIATLKICFLTWDWLRREKEE